MNIGELTKMHVRLMLARDEIMVTARGGISAIKAAREYLASALVPDQSPAWGEAEAALVDVIADRLIHDIGGEDVSDEKASLYARNIVNELFKHLKPEASE